MKSLFKLLSAIVVFSCFVALASNTSINAANTGGAVVVKHFTPAQTQHVVQSITEMNGMVKTEILLDRTRFGVCDTCKTGFMSLLSDNRRLVDSLNSENAILYENWQRSIALNDTLTKINAMVKSQIFQARVRLKD